MEKNFICPFCGNETFRLAKIAQIKEFREWRLSEKKWKALEEVPVCEKCRKFFGIRKDQTPFFTFSRQSPAERVKIDRDRYDLKLNKSKSNMQRKHDWMMKWREISENCENKNPAYCQSECEGRWLTPPCERMEKLRLSRRINRNSEPEVINL